MDDDLTTHCASKGNAFLSALMTFRLAKARADLKNLPKNLADKLSMLGAKTLVVAILREFKDMKNASMGLEKFGEPGGKYADENGGDDK